MTTPALNAVIHPLPRLRICAALRGAGATETAERRNEMRFSSLRDAAGLSDSALSKHLSVLEQAGYITRFREYGATRAKDTVWVTLTEAGTKAYEDHLAALRHVAGLGG